MYIKHMDAMDYVNIFLYGFMFLVGIPVLGMFFFAIIGILHFLMDSLSKAADEWVGDDKYNNGRREFISLYGISYFYGLIVTGIFFWAMSFGE